MTRRLVTILAVLSLGGLVFIAAGCGGDDNSNTGAETTASTATTETETTEATETEATETTETTDTTETTSDFASAENCQQFAEIGAKISSALSGTGADNLDDVQQAFDELAAAAPSEIKADFETLADWFSKVADALGDVKAGETPSADALAKLAQIDSTEVTQASQNIAAWTTENCTG